MTTKVIEGTHAISHAVQRCRAKVIAAYPITPSSGVVELLAEMCADGRLDARYVAVESEHSAMATCAGAAQTGIRAFTATSSHGLLYMHEMLHWCAGARLPIVLANVNRAVGSPWNIFADQNDSLSQRDTGWIQVLLREQPGSARHDHPGLQGRRARADAGDGLPRRVLPVAHERARHDPRSGERRWLPPAVHAGVHARHGQPACLRRGAAERHVHGAARADGSIDAAGADGGERRRRASSAGSSAATTD